MELVTQTLEPDALQAELPQIVQWLSERGIEELYVTYGVGSEASADQLWMPISVRTENLEGFVREAIRSKAFIFGHSDLLIFDAGTVVLHADRTFHTEYPAIVFTLCDESDLHFSSGDPGLIAKMKLDWISKGYKGYEAAETSRPDWVAFG